MDILSYCTNSDTPTFSSAYPFNKQDAIIKDLARLIPYLTSLRWRYAAGALFLLLTNAFALLIPWFMKLAIESLQHPQAARFSPSVCALIIILFAVLHCITRIFSRTLILNAARIIEFCIRHDLFQRLTRRDDDDPHPPLAHLLGNSTFSADGADRQKSQPATFSPVSSSPGRAGTSFQPG